MDLINATDGQLRAGFDGMMALYSQLLRKLASAPPRMRFEDIEAIEKRMISAQEHIEAIGEELARRRGIPS